MSEPEVAADLVDAAIVAHVINGGTAEAPAADGHTHEHDCLNCGKPLGGPFCAECGQAAHVHRTLAAFFHDLLHGVFHFEGRIWRTLPMLAWQPGALTRRYINGQRARYISPLALFLFCVFILFAAIQQTTHETPDEVRANAPARQAQGITAQLDKLQAERKAEVARHDDTEDTDSAIEALKSGQSGSNPSGKVAASPTPVATSFPNGLAFVDRVVRSVKENPGLARYKVEMHAYKYSWLLIPISVPFLWLLFPFNRRFPVYDHAVFVTYSISFMTLLSVIVLIGGSLGFTAIGWLMVVVPPIHMYRQLRGAYQCSRLGAALRTSALVVAAAIALVIFTLVIVAESTD